MSRLPFNQRLAEILSGGGFTFRAANSPTSTYATLAGDGVNVAATSTKVTLSLTDYPHREEVLASELVNGVFALVNLSPCDFCVLDSNGWLVIVPAIYRDRITYLDFSEFPDQSFTVLERSYKSHGRDMRWVRWDAYTPPDNSSSSGGLSSSSSSGNSRYPEEGTYTYVVEGESPADFKVFSGLCPSDIPMHYDGHDTTLYIEIKNLGWIFFSNMMIQIAFLPTHFEHKTVRSLSGLFELKKTDMRPGEYCMLDDDDMVIRPKSQFDYYFIGFRTEHKFEFYENGQRDYMASETGTLVPIKSFPPLDRMMVAHPSAGCFFVKEFDENTSSQETFLEHSVARIGTNHITSLHNEFSFDMPDTPVASGKAELMLCESWRHSNTYWSLTVDGTRHPVNTYVEIDPGTIQRLVVFASAQGANYFYLTVNLSLTAGQRMAYLVPSSTLGDIWINFTPHEDFSGHYKMVSPTEYVNITAGVEEEPSLHTPSWRGLLFGSYYGLWPRSYWRKTLSNSNGSWRFYNARLWRYRLWHYWYWWRKQYCPISDSTVKAFVDGGTKTIEHESQELLRVHYGGFYSANQDSDRHWLTDYPAAHPGITVTKNGNTYTGVGSLKHTMKITPGEKCVLLYDPTAYCFRDITEEDGQTVLYCKERRHYMYVARVITSFSDRTGWVIGEHIQDVWDIADLAGQSDHDRKVRERGLVALGFLYTQNEGDLGDPREISGMWQVYNGAVPGSDPAYYDFYVEDEVTPKVLPLQ